MKTSYIEYPSGRREYVAMGKDGLFYSYFDEACKKGYLKLHHPKFEIAVSEGFATLYPANEADCEAMYAALQTYLYFFENQFPIFSNRILQPLSARPSQLLQHEL